MIFQKTIHQNFINILISQYEKPSKPFFGNPKHHWIAQFFPSKPLNIHHLGWSGFPKTSSPGPSHPPATVAAQNALPEGAPRTWGLAKECPPQSDQSVYYYTIYIYIYVIIYIYLCNIYIYNIYIYYTKETVFERISHNKQVLDGLGDAAAHASTNWMTLYFSQDLQSADQFSEAKQTQPVHLQHHPACHSSML